ncbi:hypothetical protein QJ522_22675, partial [Sedimentisphaerales bacterium M17dextr]|nr:hypothetical protein [Sedimentisphaerales bacterium M17dextr]
PPSVSGARRGCFQRGYTDHHSKVRTLQERGMITALDDSANIFGAFRTGCEGYVVKPIGKARLLGEMEKLGLVSKVG